MTFSRALIVSALVALGSAGCTIPQERGRTPDFARVPASFILPNFKIASGPTGRSVEGPVIDSIEPGYTWISAQLKGFVPYDGGPARHDAWITLSYRYHTWYDFTAAKGAPGELAQVGRDWRCKGTDCTRRDGRRPSAGAGARRRQERHPAASHLEERRQRRRLDPLELRHRLSAGDRQGPQAALMPIGPAHQSDRLQ